MNVTTAIKHRFCCFGNLLDKVIQIGGRKQLGRSFGSGSAPDCGGLSLEEILRIDWNQVDFSEFIEDLKLKFAGTYKAPNAGELASTVEVSMESIRKYDDDPSNQANNMNGWNGKIRDDSSEADEERRLEAERQERERLARLEAERLAKLEAERLERERLAALERERQRLAQIEARRLEAERIAKQELARKRAEEEKQRRMSTLLNLIPSLEIQMSSKEQEVRREGDRVNAAHGHPTFRTTQGYIDYQNSPAFNRLRQLQSEYNQIKANLVAAKNELARLR